jgi:hypothetical protein
VAGDAADVDVFEAPILEIAQHGFRVTLPKFRMGEALRVAIFDGTPHADI